MLNKNINKTMDIQNIENNDTLEIKTVQSSTINLGFSVKGFTVYP